MQLAQAGDGNISLGPVPQGLLQRMNHISAVHFREKDILQRADHGPDFIFGKRPERFQTEKSNIPAALFPKLLESLESRASRCSVSDDKIPATFQKESLHLSDFIRVVLDLAINSTHAGQ